MIHWSRRIAEDRRFQMFILGVIIVNAIIMGIETSRPLMESYGPLLMAMNWVIQAIFILEISIRWLAYWPRPLTFFRDGWNVFDFTIVTLSLLPVAGSFATVSRLARLLRVTRLVSVSPDLRLIIETMFRSIPSMAHVGMLVSLLIYVYGIVGFYLFNEADPEHWGTLKTALLSVFQMLTLDDWMAMQKAVLPRYPWAWLFFASFVIVGVFIVVNLFIAVVLNNLETVRAEQQHAAHPQHDLLRRVEDLRLQLESFEEALRQRAAREEGSPAVGNP